jgi:hypothetical protein
VFAPGIDGLQLTSDNTVRNIRLETTPDKRAIFDDYNVDSLATITLANVLTIGQVQIVARGT